ncbi:MAG: hypothetical protein HYY96_03350 [Candidatus Tectomicrobia bacterium]|nr:hypothetical protein [Candidatus Tectomicrobia bacterium]
MKQDEIHELGELIAALNEQNTYWLSLRERLKSRLPEEASQLNSHYDVIMERFTLLEVLATRAKNALIQVMTPELVSRDKPTYDQLYALQMKLFHLRDSLVALQDHWNETNWSWFMRSLESLQQAEGESKPRG